MSLKDLRAEVKTAFMAGVSAADPVKTLGRVFEREPLSELSKGR